jgi:D-threo-aldose 1-dehydrogenase
MIPKQKMISQAGSFRVLSTRQLGSTPVRVSVLGLGGAPLGNLFEAVDERRALATIEAAAEAGVAYFDTAPQYGHGVSEHRFGHVLRHRPRGDFVLSTKVGRMLRPWRGEGSPPSVFWSVQPFEIVHDYSYDATMRSIEDSCQRLGMSRIDIALIHDVDRRHQGDDFERCLDQALNGAVRALQDLKAAGVIGAIGLGVNEIEPCVRFAEAARLDAYMLAGRLTLLEHRGLDRLMALADAQGFSMIVAGPFNSGVLATGPREGATYDYRPANDRVNERVRALDRICASHGVPLAAAALQFPLLQARVASVVTGAVRPEEILENARNIALDIPPALWRDLAEAEGMDPALLPASAA